MQEGIGRLWALGAACLAAVGLASPAGGFSGAQMVLDDLRVEQAGEVYRLAVTLSDKDSGEPVDGIAVSVEGVRPCAEPVSGGGCTDTDAGALTFGPPLMAPSDEGTYDAAVAVAVAVGAGTWTVTVRAPADPSVLAPGSIARARLGPRGEPGYLPLVVDEPLVFPPPEAATVTGGPGNLPALLVLLDTAMLVGAGLLYGRRRRLRSTAGRLSVS